MSVTIEKQGSFTVEDLMRPGAPEKFFEIIDGEFIQMTPAGHYRCRIAHRLHRLFDDYCSTRPELNFGGDNEGFLLSRNPDTLLSPYACLYRRRPELERTWLEFAPEVAVEVLSPSNTMAGIVYKRSKYFAAGTEQVWIIDPEARSIEVSYQDGRRVRIAGDETFRAEGIAQGLEIDLAALFQVP